MTARLLTRAFFTTLTAHATGVPLIALCTLEFPSSLAGAALYAVFGCFFPVVEFPGVAAGLWLLQRTGSRASKTATVLLIVLCATAIGAALTLRAGGAAPPDYLSGYAPAGFAAGVITCVSGVRFSRPPVPAQASKRSTIRR